MYQLFTHQVRKIVHTRRVRLCLHALLLASLLAGLIPPPLVSSLATSLTPNSLDKAVSTLVDELLLPPSAHAAPISAPFAAANQAPAMVPTGAYGDDFSATDYTGSSGSLSWSSNWTENDNASTSSGNIYVWTGDPTVCGLTANCLRIQANSTTNWIERQADLSGVQSASLTFHHGHASTSGTDQWAVEVSTDGITYVSIGTVKTTDGAGDYTMAIPATHFSSSFRLRFRPLTTGGDRFYLDDVVLRVIDTLVPGQIKGKVFNDGHRSIWIAV